METELHQRFTALDVWKRSRELEKEIAKVTKTFSSEEKYRLLDPIIRSVRSIKGNIAKGLGRLLNGFINYQRREEIFNLHARLN